MYAQVEYPNYQIIPYNSWFRDSVFAKNCFLSLSSEEHTAVIVFIEKLSMTSPAILGKYHHYTPKQRAAVSKRGAGNGLT